MTEFSFKDLPLAAPLHRALAEKGYTHPSPIQAKAIPVLMEGHDLLACAQTGTGKTAAFALPILQRLHNDRRAPEPHEVRTLVLAPTRELAVQIAESFETYGKYMGVSVSLAYGGVAKRPQIRPLQDGVDVLVATPGRLLDLYRMGCMDLSEVDTFVLDEADHMLDMGFIHDIRRIAKELPRERQTLMFSATMASEIAKLASSLLRHPQEIRITPSATTVDNVEQKLYFVQPENKHALLTHLLNEHSDGNPAELRLVFTKTKHGANRLATQLTRDGIAAEAIHGNKTQAARQKSLGRFREGEIGVLVATDVAARGIDVKDITLVVNYDMPNEPDSYVHRIGRTARAGASGVAISLCSPNEFGLLMAIERLISQSIPEDSDQPFHHEPLAIRHRNPSKRREDRTGSPAVEDTRKKKRNKKHTDRKGRRRATRNQPISRDKNRPRQDEAPDTADTHKPQASHPGKPYRQAEDAPRATGNSRSFDKPSRADAPHKSKARRDFSPSRREDKPQREFRPRRAHNAYRDDSPRRESDGRRDGRPERNFKPRHADRFQREDRQQYREDRPHHAGRREGQDPRREYSPRATRYSRDSYGSRDSYSSRDSRDSRDGRDGRNGRNYDRSNKPGRKGDFNKPRSYGNSRNFDRSRASDEREPRSYGGKRGGYQQRNTDDSRNTRGRGPSQDKRFSKKSDSHPPKGPRSFNRGGKPRSPRS